MSCRSLTRIQCASDSARLVSLRVQERRGRRQEERPGAPRVCEQPAFGATGAKGLQQRNAVARRAPAALLPSVSFRSMSFQNFRLPPPGPQHGFSDLDTPPHSPTADALEEPEAPEVSGAPEAPEDVPADDSFEDETPVEQQPTAAYETLWTRPGETVPAPEAPHDEDRNEDDEPADWRSTTGEHRF